MSEQPSTITVEQAKRFIPLSGLSNVHIEDVLAHSKTIQVPKGRVLFKRNEVATHWYYLHQGSLDLCDADFNVTPIRSGSSTARHPVERHTVHKVSAVTTADSVFLQVDFKRLELVLTWSQASASLATDGELGNIKQAETDWTSNLLLSPVMTKVPAARIQDLLNTFSDVTFNEGDTLFTRGEQGDCFYAIQSGAAHVVRTNDEGEDTLVSVLKTGDCMGEEALIGDASRNATVRIPESCTLMSIDKEQFDDLLVAPDLTYIDKNAVKKTPDNVLVDVRLAPEYEHQHQDLAINIPLANIRENAEYLSPDQTYIILGEASPRAELAAYLLQQAGLNVVIERLDDQA